MSFSQDSLFEASGGEDADEAPRLGRRMPLAARMRARSLDEVVGQEHLLGEDCLLPRLLTEGVPPSMLFYGPPGCGKTTLAEVIASQAKAHFMRLNAVLSNVAQMRDCLRMARYREEATILFIDEIHRFNKAQQDLLLPDVEAGHISLIGATTHNPGFYIIDPLLSRSHLFRLEPVGTEAITKVLQRALEDEERGLANRRCTVEPVVLDALARMSDGDLRRALNSLETLVECSPIAGHVGQAELERYAAERQIRYDAKEDEHYDTASAFIKSMRGCDPDASLYWLAKMLAGGEDPRFIARRLVILASEDVGLADSRALPLAVATFKACEIIGLPECELNLAHCTLFLATAPKSNSATMALGEAKRAIASDRVQSVPLHLRDSHSKVSKQIGAGKGYLYSHDFEEAISGQDYLEEPLALYKPVLAGAEAGIAERLQRWKALKEQRADG